MKRMRRYSRTSRLSLGEPVRRGSGSGRMAGSALIGPVMAGVDVVVARSWGGLSDNVILLGTAGHGRDGIIRGVAIIGNHACRGMNR